MVDVQYLNKLGDKLIENLPEEWTCVETPQEVDVVLDGGLFNGTYLIGALWFLKAMEKKGYIKVTRISGSSIGSLAALCYFCDALFRVSDLYEVFKTEFTTTFRLSQVKQLQKLMGESLPTDLLDRVNGRLYITYNNIAKGKKPVKNKYRSVEELMDCIVRSCYLPMMVDEDFLYKGQYADGGNPYFFPKTKGRRILFFDLYGYDKIQNMFNIRNENTVYHRVLAGMLDVHAFFIKQRSTPMCSFVDAWSATEMTSYRFKWVVEKISVWVLRVIMYVKQTLPPEFRDTLLYKIVSKVSHDVFLVLVEHFCL